MQVIFKIDDKFWVGSARLSDEYPDAMKVPSRYLSRSMDGLARKFPNARKIEAIERYGMADENVAMCILRGGD